MSALAYAVTIYQYTAKDGKIYYTGGMPTGLTTAEKAQYSTPSQANIDAITKSASVPLNSREVVKAQQRKDNSPVVVPPVVVTCTPPQVLNTTTNKCETPTLPASRGELDPQGQNLMPYVNTALVPKGSAGFSVPMIKAAGIPPADTVGAFRISCEYSHMNNDDPIVYPGVPNATHHHTFFGNTGANAYSTTESLLATGNSTCAGGILNRSGYWMPSLINTKTGAPAKPDVVVVYYKGNDQATNKYITAPPKGLRMIAGEVKPMTTSQGKGKFFCQDGSKNNAENNWGIMWADNHMKGLCGGANQMLRMIVEFPMCWDGKNLDSPDHKSHMAHLNGQTVNGCPASHPVLLPTITINADFYNLDATAKYRLSSDNYKTDYAGGYSLHADWMNGWDEPTLQRMVKNCLKNAKNCGGPNLGDGETLYGVNQD